MAGTPNSRLAEQLACHAQIEYHYYHQTNITIPKQMLAVLKGLMARDMRVFSVEPNYWWLNYAQEFLEFAYIQVRDFRLHAIIYASGDCRGISYDCMAHCIVRSFGWEHQSQDIYMYFPAADAP